MRDPPHSLPPQSLRQLVLLVVEGAHDVSFLSNLSRILAADDPDLPDLSECTRRGELIFVPFGGGSPLAWTHRFAPFGVPELHLYDRELPPESNCRHLAAERVNSRPGCAAFVTTPRALENYLHPQAITDASGGDLQLAFGPDDCVPTAVARAGQVARSGTACWSALSRHERTRLIQKAKRWLNTTAVQFMTAPQLAESDPAGDLRLWLHTAAHLLNQECRTCHAAGAGPWPAG